MRVLTDKELLSLRNLLALRKRKHGISHLRVAIYARKSAEDDKQTSIPTQISLCEKFVSDYSDLLQVKYKFSEDDASGMQSYNRPEYLKMMNLALMILNKCTFQQITLYRLMKYCKEEPLFV